MQRKKKRSIIFELHSIPIKLRSLWTDIHNSIPHNKKYISNSKRLYLVSYSIPLSCMVALLLVSGMALFGVGASDPAYADWLAGDLDTEAPGNTAASAFSTVKLSIGGAGKDEVVETGVEQVAYRSHTVEVILDNVAEYYLMVAGEDKLTPPVGGDTVVGVGEAGVVGRDIQPGTWGYAWDYTDNVDDENMLYKTVPVSNSELEGPALSNGAVNFVGKLNFAANFPINATLGNYVSKARLTLIATPKANTGTVNLWRNTAGEPTAVNAGTDEMQGVGPYFCGDEVKPGWTLTLKDNRDNSTYTIIKLDDGSCWMGDNLTLHTNNVNGMLLASEDSSFPSGMTWVLPASLTGEPNTTDATLAQIKTGSSELRGWMEGYGDYYSWCAATAGTCQRDGVALERYAEASASICPKGWRLPSVNGMGSFESIMNSYTGAWLSSYDENDVLEYSGVRLGGDYAKAYFPAAGNYTGGTRIAYAGDRGRYWSRLVYSSDMRANVLDISDGSPASIDVGVLAGQHMVSIRCVQDPNGYWENNGDNVIDAKVRTMQDITRENFTEKYCSRAQDSVVRVGATIKLRDTRDGKVYTIVKMADGNCWMQENLALDGENVGKGNSDNTDIASGSSAVLPESNGASFVKDGWQESYGDYYDWLTATARTGSAATVAEGEATGSICPRGWKLPTGGASGGQVQLLFGVNGDSLGSSYLEKFNAVQTGNYKFPAAGYVDYYDTGLLKEAGMAGYYWTRTSLSKAQAYAMYFDGNNFYPGTYIFNRSQGLPIRCIAEPSE